MQAVSGPGTGKDTHSSQSLFHMVRKQCDKRNVKKFSREIMSNVKRLGSVPGLSTPAHLHTHPPAHTDRQTHAHILRLCSSGCVLLTLPIPGHQTPRTFQEHLTFWCRCAREVAVLTTTFSSWKNQIRMSHVYILAPRRRTSGKATGRWLIDGALKT